MDLGRETNRWLESRTLVNGVLDRHWQRNQDASAAARLDPEFAAGAKLLTGILTSVADVASREGLDDLRLRRILSGVLHERLGDQAVREARDRQAAFREAVTQLERGTL